MKDLQIIQKNELIILKEIKRICEKHDLTYYLSSGTLLGAVRHNGFIPWDDDIDIEMPLPDYRKFIEFCKTELNPRFFLQNYKTDTNDHFAFTKIRMNNTAFIPGHHIKHHIHHGFWVDIFPVVRAPKSKLLKKAAKTTVMISNYIQIGDFIRANYDEFYAKLGKFGIKTVLLFNKLPVSFKVKFHSFLLKPVMRKPKHDRPLACLWVSLEFLPQNIYDELIDHKFEDENFKIPKRYDDYLTHLYGDYMKLPPENERQGHGHCFIISENKDYSEFLQ